MILSDAIASAILQVMLFACIPFTFYLIKYRKIKGFNHYIGFIRPKQSAIYLSLLLSLMIVILTYGVFVLLGIADVLSSPSTTAGQIKALQTTIFMSGCAILIKAVFQTALSEEIFFRGFIGKRLINKFGFPIGNTLQSLVFGFLHGGMMIASSSISTTAIICVMFSTSLAGYMLGYIKEKIGNGSIWPGWFAHSLANCISFSVIVFI